MIRYPKNKQDKMKGEFKPHFISPRIKLAWGKQFYNKVVSTGLYLCPKMNICANRAFKIKVPPKEMLLTFSIGTILANYDIINRKL